MKSLNKENIRVKGGLLKEIEKLLK